MIVVAVETKFHDIAQADLKLMILLSQLPRAGITDVCHHAGAHLHLMDKTTLIFGLVMAINILMGNWLEWGYEGLVDAELSKDFFKKLMSKLNMEDRGSFPDSSQIPVLTERLHVI